MSSCGTRPRREQSSDGLEAKNVSAPEDGATLAERIEPFVALLASGSLSQGQASATTIQVARLLTEGLFDDNSFGCYRQLAHGAIGSTRNASVILAAARRTMERMQGDGEPLDNPGAYFMGCVNRLETDAAFAALGA